MCVGSETGNSTVAAIMTRMLTVPTNYDDGDGNCDEDEDDGEGGDDDDDGGGDDDDDDCGDDDDDDDGEDDEDYNSSFLFACRRVLALERSMAEPVAEELRRVCGNVLTLKLGLLHFLTRNFREF